ncbi:MAG TPA: S-adenosylmethionine:tRNA ribosyltransferase-isomerase [Bacteroidia bacterium]|nr:S-adenosylmethionine:tRNA ribosyltransferase-isomerase [Bacteroidia bacterium]
MRPEDLDIKNFSYDLPDEKIARFPLEKRDDSKLLVYRDGKISESVFRNMAMLIPAESLLVFNSTKVVHARLLMQRKSGATVEIFCTDSGETDMDFPRLLGKTGSVTILAFIGNGKRWKEDERLGATLKIGEKSFALEALRAGQKEDQFLVHLSWNDADIPFLEILGAAGKVPLPPYLGRDEEENDRSRYQTVYARTEGSVAAPTAGLHFTEHVLDELRRKNVHLAEVTLHVGAGTFRPVKAATMAGHEMHREQVFIPEALVEMLCDKKMKPVIAVGTTSLRTLESIYWFGRQLVLQPGTFRNELFVSQWEPYEEGPDVPAEIALRAVRDWMTGNNHETLEGYTKLLIAPGYRFRIADALITNFHQPQSTLLLLVAAFTGDDFRRIYDYALQHDFRFLSYGDSSLLWRK